MRCVRATWWWALLVSALVLLAPTSARADGGLDAAMDVLAGMAAQSLGVLFGVTSAAAALVSRARWVWLLALACVVVNGVTGVVAFATTRPILPFIVPASLQVVLGVVVGPCLIVWRQAGLERRDATRPAARSRRWLVLWILGNTIFGLAAGFAAMALGRWVVSSVEPREPLDTLRLLLAVTGLVNGMLLGSVQWLLLRRLLGISAGWIALTALGGAATGYLTPSFSTHAALGYALGGVVLGAAQWPLLRERLNHAWLWVVLGAALRLLGIPLLSLQAESHGGLVVLTWLVTAFDALVTGLTLERFARQ